LEVFVEGGICFATQQHPLLFSLFLGGIQATVTPIFLRAGKF
jgi:hypothetical protein